MRPTPFCAKCGAANQPQAAYCRSCGDSLQAIKPTIYNSTTGRLLVNSMLKQRYRIVSLVDKGGMGAVYHAEDTQLGNRPVALKEMNQSGLSPQAQKEAADAFKQEALILARLQHPNLPSIFDHFEENGRWYLVMTFIQGETLEAYLSHNQDGKLPLNEAVQIGIQLCTVLSYLHDQQPAVIFRDLKPANIMRSPDGHIYLIDFGIARHFKPGKAKDTLDLGSPGYAAPEQHGRTQTTPRSDIYSLGATLYQLISGHDPSSSPFHFPPLQSLIPSVPAGLATFITQMLAMDEGKRPANAHLVRQALQTAIPQQSIQANSVPQASPLPNLLPSRPLSPPQSLPLAAPGPQGTLLLHYTGHYQAVQSAIWSPDGTRIASASQDKTVQIWNANSGRKTFIYPEHSASVCSLTWSPDSKYLTTATSDATVQMWNADSNRPPFIYRGLSRDNYENLPVICSPDGRYIAVALRSGMVQVANANGSGKPFVYKGHTAFYRSLAVSSIVWSPDGKRIASVYSDHTVQVWSIDGSQQPFIYKGHVAPVQCVAWSPDGQRIASSSQDKTVQVWTTDGSQQPPFIYKGHVASVQSVAWSPDGRRIASIAQDKTVQVWNADGSKHLFIYRGHVASVQLFSCCSVAWSPDGEHIASIYNDKIVHTWNGSPTTSFGDKTVHVWNADGSGQPFIYKGHAASVQYVAWSPDGKHIASASLGKQDNTVHVWNTDGDAIWRPFIYTGHTDTVLVVTWSPDGKRIASASQDQTVQVWNADTFIHKGHSGIVWSVAWSPDGKRIASASQDQTIQVGNADGNGQISVYKNHADVVFAIAWSPDGKRIASASQDQTVQVGNADGSGKSFIYTGHTDTVLAVAWSPDGTRLASASQDKTVHVWSIDGSGRFFIYRGHTDAVLSVAWSPNGTRIVSASHAREDAVHVWNADGSGSPFIYEGHNCFVGEVIVTSVAWSPDGTRIASSTSGTSGAPHSADKVLHVWNADGSEQPFIYRGHTDAVHSAAWSPDGTRIVSTSKDGSVHVWSAG